jgi:antibiotic biosynthesis monooxygenase (ABM) superfamily enzyme
MTTSTPPQSSLAAPPRYKLAIVSWAAAYPTITVLLAAFKPLGLMALPPTLRRLRICGSSPLTCWPSAETISAAAHAPSGICG